MQLQINQEKKKKNTNKYNLVDAGVNVVGKKVKKGLEKLNGLRITLTSNEVKDIVSN